MRILTYANPFELQQNPEIWNLISRHPHFCASDTLVQGLSHCYGRTAFKTLRPIQDLLETFYQEYTANPVSDMQLFLVVSAAIRQWEDEEIKQAFLFNKAEVVKAIQLLLPLECDIARFDKALLSEEQRRFLCLMQKAAESSCFENLDLCRKKTLEDYQKAIDEANLREINYCLNALIHDSKFKLNELDLHLPIKKQNDAVRTAQQVLEYIQTKREENLFYPQSASHFENSLRVACSLFQDQSDDYYSTVIFHGIHQFTPLMLFLFQHLEKLGVQVIFLINYASNLPKLYQTWKTVYRWCDTKFEFASPVDLEQGNALGRSIACVVEGMPDLTAPQDLIEYATMTSFATNEVSRRYEDTITTGNVGSLSKMSTQYYAVQGRHCNEILQMYFPEQFRDKPFLSYPVGQFILGLYQMWDFEGRQLKINPTSLSECVVSGIFNPGPGLLDTIRKTKLFFSDVDSFQDYMARIRVLEEVRSNLNNHHLYDWDLLRQISFFGIKNEELSDFKTYLERIQKIADLLFSGMSEQIDYLRHFQNLIELISSPEYGGNYISNSERELIQEITGRLASPSTEKVVGDSRDLRDALAFFLSGRLDSDSSNWIVRDFMQIDGAVLQSNTSTANTYHFALLSNEHMTRSNNSDLPWPLTTEMFGQYCEAAQAVDAVTAGQREKRNYLRYILFYGVFFSKKNIELSYIKEEDGETQTPYYLLSALGMSKKPFEDPFAYRFVLPGQSESQTFQSDSLNEEEKELFSICPFKYLFNRIIKTPIEYSSEFHIKYFLSFALAYVVWKRTHGNTENISPELDRGIKELKKMFPFWGESVFTDIKDQAASDLNNATGHMNPYTYTYVRRKSNFLVAKWNDPNNNGVNIFNRTDADAKWPKYMQSSQIYPLPSELPPTGICNDCSFSEFCLREFYDAHKDAEEG